MLVITSGDRRVDERRWWPWWAAIGRADAQFVKERTGFPLGCLAVAHATPPVTLIDRDLLRFDVVWAAAGHPHGVFPLPGDLQRLTGAPVVDGTGTGSAMSATEAIAARARLLGALQAILTKIPMK